MFSSLARHKVALYVTVFVCLCTLLLWQSMRPSNSKLNWNSIKGLSYSDFTPGANHRVEYADLDELAQDDPYLINYLRQYHIYPPSARKYRYSTLDESRLHFINESRLTTGIIQTYLKNMNGGVFVEAGANNGADEMSNTLVLERDFRWSGLLVEGSPLVFPKLLAAHRKSWKSDLLLSKFAHSKLVVFYQRPNIYAGKEHSSHPKDAPVAVVAKDGKTPLLHFELLTVPLYSLIAACNYETIDYLSLDVEGSELEILESFPFDKVLIRTMMVEVNVLGDEKTQQLVDFLLSKGYHKHPTRPTERDIIFIHKSVLENYKKPG